MNKKIFFIFIFIFMLCPSSPAQTLQDLFSAGEKYYNQGRYQDAITQYEKAVEIDPDFAPAYNSLGLAHQAIGTRVTDIIWFFRVATDLDPEFTDARVNLCRIYAEADQFENARDACLTALEIEPNLGSAELQLAWIYLTGLQQPDKAVLYFRRVLQKVQEPSVYFGLGMAYVQAGDSARVLETITTLRGMGEHDFATQLEDAQRAQSAPAAPSQPSAVSLPQRTSGTLIEAHAPSPPPPPQQTSPVSGQMRIRLKGSLFGSDQ